MSDIDQAEDSGLETKIHDRNGEWFVNPGEYKFQDTDTGKFFEPGVYTKAKATEWTKRNFEAGALMKVPDINEPGNRVGYVPMPTPPQDFNPANPAPVATTTEASSKPAPAAPAQAPAPTPAAPAATPAAPAPAPATAPTPSPAPATK